MLIITIMLTIMIINNNNRINNDNNNVNYNKFEAESYQCIAHLPIE